MSRRSKIVPKSLSPSQLSVRVLLGIAIILIFFLITYFLNHYYFYSLSKHPETTLPNSEKVLSNSKNTPPSQENNLSCPERSPDLTFFERLTQKKSSHSTNLSVIAPSTKSERSYTLTKKEPSHPLANEIKSNHTFSDPTLPEQKTYIPDTIYTVQAGSFRHLEHAQNMLEVLKKKGFKPFIAPVQLSQGEIWYRVRVGNFLNRAEAEKTSRKLQEGGDIQPLIISLKKSKGDF